MRIDLNGLTGKQVAELQEFVDKDNTPATLTSISGKTEAEESRDEYHQAYKKTRFNVSLKIRKESETPRSVIIDFLDKMELFPEEAKETGH